MLSSDEEAASAELQALLLQGLRDKVFVGAAAGVAWRDTEHHARLAFAHAGHLSPGGPEVTRETYFDLASLTKPVFAMSVLRLVAQGRLRLSDDLQSMGIVSQGALGADLTVEELLSHRSGLAAWGDYYKRLPFESGSLAARRWMFEEALKTFDPQQRGRALYSDLGYWTLGYALEQHLGQSVATIVEEQTLKPLSLSEYLGYFSPAWLRARGVAVTEQCSWRSRFLQGEVHDENAAALGGISAHAGLFGKIEGVLRFGVRTLDAFLGDDSWLESAFIQPALKERSHGTFRLGWDGKSAKGSSAGAKLSAKSFGHLGFTGTSLWCDPSLGLTVALLSNRVCPSRQNEAIKAFRPLFHDKIVGRLTISSG